MRRTLIMLVIAALIVSASAGATKPNWQYRTDVWMPGHWYRLAVCESGSNPPNWQHNSGTYEGAFGFWYGTWDQYKLAGYPSGAHLATPWQQYRTALRVARATGGIQYPWGCWRGSDHAWVRGKVAYNAIT